MLGRLMVVTRVAVVLVLVLITAGEKSSLAAGSIIYVDPDADGENTGESWADAYGDLSFALEESQSGDKIWVAEGYYKPNRLWGSTDPRSASYRLKNGVALYGGFDPDAGVVDFEERDWVTYAVILSGDHLGNDAAGFVGYGDNFYHIFYHPDELALNSTAILDGFTIMGGNASGDYIDANGGGMLNLTSSPTIRNCTFKDNLGYHGGGISNHNSSPAISDTLFSNNKAYTYGGGMVNFNSSLPTLEGCIFSNNSASEGGGIYNSEGSSPILNDCILDSNTADNGGGMYNFETSPNMTNVTFTHNTAVNFGGGMTNLGSMPAMQNCTFNSNTATMGGGIWNSSSSPTLIDCTFNDNSASGSGGGMSNDLYSAPAITNCTFQGNSAGDKGGGIYNFNTNSAPVLNGCTFTDNTADYGGGMSNADTGWEVGPVLNNCTFTGNTALQEGGGMYNYHSSPTLNSCTFSDNQAGANGGGISIGGPTQLNDCTFSGNSAVLGGGLYHHGEFNNPILINCTFSGNTASQSGGGMYSGESTYPHLTACTFSGNTAVVSGGGLYLASNLPTLINCRLTGNSAGQGGGIFSRALELTLDFCTFTGNSAGLGGAIYMPDISEIGGSNVFNSILWGDTPSEIYVEGDAGTMRISFSDVQGGYTGVGNIDADPRFLDPLNEDLHLLPGSACIDTGLNDGGGLNISLDFEGDPRILDGDGDGTATADMGIDEVDIVHYFIRLPMVLRLD